MASEKRYKHISVHADEEDDLVIQAGVPCAASSKEASGSAVDAVGSAGQDKPMQAADASLPGGQAEGTAPSDILHGAPSSLVEQAASDEARAEYLAHRRRSEQHQALNAMVTTEEDLKTKMPFAKMQAVIVFAGVALLLLALVYWFVLR